MAEGVPKSMKVALVTGASSGLGRALALRLASAGWAVGLAARRKDDLDAVAAEIHARGGAAHALACDVGERASVHAAAAACAAALGPVDLLVANAGVSENTHAGSLDAREVERLVRVNYLGSVYAVEAVLPGMLARGSGQLVAVGSLAGLGGLPLSAAYSASKAAQMDFFEALRIDLRGKGVAVTVVAPGYVRSPMTDRNRFPMPFMIELDDAVERIARAIERRDRLVLFPWQLAWIRWVAQIFPRSLYDAIASRLRRDKRRDPDAPLAQRAPVPHVDAPAKTLPEVRP
jgi:short-subunit dehydrogenase